MFVKVGSTKLEILKAVLASDQISLYDVQKNSANSAVFAKSIRHINVTHIFYEFCCIS